MEQTTNDSSPVKKLRLLAVAGVLLGAVGCANTLNGAKQDAATDTQKAATAADQAAATAKAEAQKAGAAVVAVPQDAKAATIVTPEVKTAIVRDPVLNDPRNLINVNSIDHAVHLTGHVVDASMKTRATEDAQATLSKHHDDFQVVNEFVVTAAGA